jgi:hypothetical protein
MCVKWGERQTERESYVKCFENKNFPSIFSFTRSFSVYDRVWCRIWKRKRSGEVFFVAFFASSCFAFIDFIFCMPSRICKKVISDELFFPQHTHIYKNTSSVLEWSYAQIFFHFFFSHTHFKFDLSAYTLKRPRNAIKTTKYLLRFHTGVGSIKISSCFADSLQWK